jgi:hypothetical protein
MSACIVRRHALARDPRRGLQFDQWGANRAEDTLALLTDSHKMPPAIWELRGGP